VKLSRVKTGPQLRRKIAHMSKSIVGLTIRYGMTETPALLADFGDSLDSVEAGPETKWVRLAEFPEALEKIGHGE
jgi:hypothetical protein